MGVAECFYNFSLNLALRANAARWGVFFLPIIAYYVKYYIKIARVDRLPLLPFKTEVYIILIINPGHYMLRQIMRIRKVLYAGDIIRLMYSFMKGTRVPRQS